MQCISCSAPATGTMHNLISHEFAHCCSFQCGQIALIGDKRKSDEDDPLAKRRYIYNPIAPPRSQLAHLVDVVEPKENVLMNDDDILSRYPAVLMTNAPQSNVVWLVPNRVPTLFEKADYPFPLAHVRADGHVSGEMNIIIRLDDSLNPTIVAPEVAEAWRRAVEQATTRRFVVVDVTFDGPDYAHAGAILWDRVDGNAIFLEPHGSPPAYASDVFNLHRSTAELSKFVMENLVGVKALWRSYNFTDEHNGPQSWFGKLRPQAGRIFGIDGGWCMTAVYMWIAALVKNAPSRRPLIDWIGNITANLRSECSTWVRYGPDTDSWLINYHHYLLEKIYDDLELSYYGSIFEEEDIVMISPADVQRVQRRVESMFASARTAM